MKINVVMASLVLLVQLFTLLAVFVAAWVALNRRLTRVETLLEGLQWGCSRIRMVKREPVECEGKTGK